MPRPLRALINGLKANDAGAFERIYCPENSVAKGKSVASFLSPLVLQNEWWEQVRTEKVTAGIPDGW